MMNQLYPLKLQPIFKPKVWGGKKIKTELGIDFGILPNCGEAWMASGIKNNESVIANGFLAGNHLLEVSEIYLDSLLGQKVIDKYGLEFPLLVKILDTKDYLSIQVHPDDELAQKRHGCFGKNEMWYIIQAGKDAELINGFNKNIDEEELLAHLEKNTLKDILNVEKVKAGDVFEIPAKRVHAIGPDILLAEIQQSSDITYRIYDWDRRDKDGNTRELHTEQSLEAIDYDKPKGSKKHLAEQQTSLQPLVSDKYYQTNLISIEKKLRRNYDDIESFIILLCIEGSFSLKYEEGEEQIKKGDCFLIPAFMKGIDIITKEKGEILEIFVP